VLDGGSSDDEMLDHLDLICGWHGRAKKEEVLSSEQYLCFHEPDLDYELTGIAIKPDCVPGWISSLHLLWKGVNNND
jgi:hypothetical protein